MSGLSRPAKRHGVADTQTIARLQEQVTNLRNILERMLTPTRPQGGFFMRTVQSSEYAAERQRMIDYLWKGAYEDAVSEILEANPDLEWLHGNAHRWHGGAAASSTTRRSTARSSSTASYAQQLSRRTARLPLT